MIIISFPIQQSKRIHLEQTMNMQKSKKCMFRKQVLKQVLKKPGKEQKKHVI